MLALLILIIIVTAIWLALMALAICVPYRPQVIKLTRRWVCPPGSEMRIESSVASYHRPGEKGLIVECVHPDGTARLVTGKAISYLACQFFVLALPLATMLVLFIRNLLF